MPRSNKDTERWTPPDPRTLSADQAMAVVMSGRSYFSSSAEVENFEDWDIKGDWTIRAILGVIASGDTIMLSKTKSGDAINIAISSAPKVWQRTFVRDAEAWDEVMIKLARACAKPVADLPAD